MKTKYVCEYCDEEYDTAEECIEHENCCPENPEVEKALIGHYYYDYKSSNSEKGRVSYLHILGWDKDWKGLHGLRITIDADDCVSLVVCHENYTKEDLDEYVLIDESDWNKVMARANLELNPPLDKE